MLLISVQPIRMDLHSTPQSNATFQDKKLQGRIQKLQNHILKNKEKSEFVFNLRLGLGVLIFVLFTVAVLIPQLKIELVVLGVGIPLFFWLVVVSQKLKSFKEKLTLLQMFYQRRINRMRGFIEAEPTPAFPLQLSDNDKILAHDIDLIGEHSLWSYLDETFTPLGGQKLANWMFSPSHIEDVLARQKNVSQLARYSGLLRKLSIIGLTGETQFKDLPLLTSELKSSFFTPSARKFSYVVYFFFLLSLLEFVMSFQYAETPILFRLLFPLLSIASLKFTSDVFGRGLQIEALMEKLVPVFVQLYKLPSLKTNIVSDIKTFAQRLSYLTVNSHPLVGILLNLLTPWNLFFASRLESARETLHKKLPAALDELSEIEALHCLVVLYKHETQVFPQFGEQLSVSNVRHPLSNPASFIKNSFEFKPPYRLALLTGSNMSGKSTFLRTLGINQVLAMMGAPVYAKTFVTRWARVYSCLRVSDSLREGASYFYAEVKRLKEIIEKSHKETVFFLIDEIFKGTNNRERYIGSRDVIKALAETQSFGFVSTHDLELSKLSESSQVIQNWHFTDRVEGQKMVFDYQIKPGPCPSTNALRIMKIEGLPVSES